MASRTTKGKEIRNYFIEVEKDFKQNQQELLPPASCGKIYHHEQIVNPQDEKLRNAIYLAHQGKCYYTKKKLHKRDFHLDHVYPVSKGGRDTISNLVLCTPAYNLHKGDNVPVALKNLQIDLLQNYTDIAIEIYNNSMDISIAHKRLSFGSAILRPGVMQEFDNRFGRETTNKYIVDMTGIDYDPENSNDKKREDYFVDRDMSYEEFKVTIRTLGYENMKSFTDEIGINKGTPATTWKIQGNVPYLVKMYVLGKFNDLPNGK
jgi:hypothetical protein